MLAFIGNMFEKNGSLPNLPGTNGYQPLCQKDPTYYDNKLGVIDITKCKCNVIKILQHRNKHASHWHAVNGGCENCLSKLLGLSLPACEQVMMIIKIFTMFKGKVTPKKN